ncbi:MAG: DUF58 domain-containing protein [Chloroflexota bacterium]
MADQVIFDSQFLQAMERLRLVLRRRATGTHAGERRSQKKGSSVEFADFRNYVPGDDLRQVDWNAYARLERMFMKLFMEEQDTTVLLYLDASASMDWGTPSKGVLAKRLIGALAYLTLAGLDRVVIAAGNDQLRDFRPPARGRGAAPELWDYIANLRFAGQTDLNRALRDTGRLGLHGGIAVVVSDLLSPSGYEQGLQYLRFRRQEVTVIQILSQDELHPELTGDLRLIDSETGESRDVSLTPSLIAAYEQRLAARQDAIRRFCHAQGVSFLPVSSGRKAEDIVLEALRGAGIVA